MLLNKLSFLNSPSFIHYFDENLESVGDLLYDIAEAYFETGKKLCERRVVWSNGLTCWVTIGIFALLVQSRHVAKE